MKLNTKLSLVGLVLGTMFGAGLGGVSGADVTAFTLIKDGNRYIGEQAKDKVVQIRSEKSVGQLHPNIWFIVYYDPTASLKAVEVKFGAGQMLETKRPFRLFERMGAADKVMDRDKLKIDSDRAIAIAQKQPLLEKLTIKATKMELERREGVATWKVRLYAAKLNNPNKDVDIGDVYITADEGKVVKSDLHINRVD